MVLPPLIILVNLSLSSFPLEFSSDTDFGIIPVGEGRGLVGGGVGGGVGTGVGGEVGSVVGSNASVVVRQQLSLSSGGLPTWKG